MMEGMKPHATTCAKALIAAIVLNLAMACDSTSSDEPAYYEGLDMQPVCGVSSGGGCGDPEVYGGCYYPRGAAGLVVEGPACLTVNVSNCASLDMDIQNNCADAARIGGLNVAAGAVGSGTILRDSDGNFQLIDVPDGEEPDDEVVTITGVIGAQSVAITFVVSEELC